MKTLLIAILFSSSFAQAARFVVEAKKQLTPNETAKIQNVKVQAWIKNSDPYLSRLYSVSGNVTKAQLEKLAWVKSVENTVELTQLSLEPVANSERLVEDELFPYQWSLLNQGQTYVREKDDIHNIPLLGVNGKDVGWKQIYNNLPKGRPIVAVLDSGVDLNHPDLQGNLWKNEKECGQDPKIDHDDNKLPGDCDGWNFTESIDADEAKSPQDNDGHGSHVAGIIAAANNGFGIVGVNPNALIMPVKVMRDSNSKGEISSSESFAQGIIYATNMGAHVINLSLGWPRSLETKHLKDAIYYALSRNVIIVAAAGNNNSSEPLFPCAYDGVICAAASTLDGKFAGFSNYGGHVDAVTPGEGILSLYPTFFEPDFFSVPGYDIKSGTSQAAPLLAGLISIAKALEPELKIDEVFGRLYSAAQNADKKKFIMGGVASWEALSKKVTGPVVRPVLKRVRQIVLVGDRTDTKLLVPVRNFGLETQNVQVKVESLSAGIVFQSESAVIENLKNAEVKDLTFNVKVTDINAESSATIKVTVTSTEGELAFLNEVPVVRDIKSEAEFKKSNFVFNKESFPLGNVVNGKIVSFISTVDTYGKSSKREFYVRKTLKEEKKMEISVMTRNANTITEAPRRIVLENFATLVNFIRLDLNFDGKEDYLIQSVHEDTKGKFFQFSFYNEEMKPLWPSFQDVRVTLDLTVANMNDLSFTRMDHPTLGAMMVPAFFTEGQLPKADQVQDFFGRWDGAKEFRLYYLEPQVKEKTLRIRAITTTVWKESVKKELNAKWFETVMVENILPVSVSDAHKGELRVILSVGQGTKRQIFISTFDTKKTLRGKALPQLVLQTEGVDTVFSITPSGLDAAGDAFLNIYDRSRAKLVTTKNADQSSQLNYSHVSETDIMAGHIVSFENGNHKFSVLQTRDELIGLSTINGKVTKSSRPKLRYSFLSDKILSEFYHPVIFKRAGTQAPALYVDSTAVTANRVYLFEEQAGKLVASIKNSIIVPATCKALNPAFSAASGSHEFVFLCLENKEWFVRTYAMN
jgi:cell wall-associated protease